MDFGQRSRELREWWLLRRKDPAALSREQQRSYYAAAGNPAGPGTPDLPNPRGPRPLEIGAVAGATLLVLALFGAALDTAPPTESKSLAATTSAPTGTVGSTTASAEPTRKSDLPPVPVGQPQTIEGTAKKTGPYKATVTVTFVTRTSDSNVHITAKVDVLDGTLPMVGAWSLVTKSGQDVSLSLYEDESLGDELTGEAEGTAEGIVSADTELRYVRLQPRHTAFTEGDNQAAVWSIGAVTTSLTPTPTFPAPTQGTTGTDGVNPDLPNAGVPNPNLPNVPNGCIDGRDRKGRFC